MSPGKTSSSNPSLFQMPDASHIYCISDLHLSPERPDIHRAFSAFLADITGKADTLFILGDFFNLWIGDDDPDPFADGIKHELKSLASSGTDLYLMHGNRDFLLGMDFCGACNAALIEEPYMLKCGDSRFLLMHGDALCTRDTDYMAFREMVRNSAWQSAFLAKPLAERQAFAQEARARSKAMSSNKAEDIMDVTPDAVENVMKEAGLLTLVHGHTHRPAVHDIVIGGQPGKRIVLGDWDQHGWFLEITPDGFSLENFPV